MPLLPKSPRSPSAPRPVAALHEARPGLRRQAIRDLAGQPGTATLLADQLSCETDASVRHALLGALAEHPDGMSLVALADCLRSGDASVRNGAIDALRFNPLRRRLVADSLLDDPDVDVRLGALTLLDDAEPMPAAERDAKQARLLHMLDHDSDVNVCAAVLGLLENIADENALPSLLSLRRRFEDEPYIQFAAARVIMRFEEGSAR